MALRRSLLRLFAPALAATALGLTSCSSLPRGPDDAPGIAQPADPLRSKVVSPPCRWSAALSVGGSTQRASTAGPVQYAYSNAGLRLPRTAAAQMDASAPVTLENARPVICCSPRREPHVTSRSTRRWPLRARAEYGNRSPSTASAMPTGGCALRGQAASDDGVGALRRDLRESRGASVGGRAEGAPTGTGLAAPGCQLPARALSARSPRPAERPCSGPTSG